MTNKLIKNFIAPYKNEIKTLLKKIKEFDRIVIFRHQTPDFDAIGTQLGLYHFIKDNFPSKDVHVVGENHVVFTPRLYPPMEILDDEYYDNPFLAIVVDTADTKRVSDDHFKKAAYIIKIDHHPNKEPYGNINIVVEEAAAASELVCAILYSFGDKYYISQQSAKYFYSALAGDSGRFLFNSTSPLTFEIAKLLISTGFNLSKDVYQKMYQKQIEDLRVTAYVLNNFIVSPKGVAYYILSEEIQDELNITFERGKENLGQLANIEGIHIWCSITENRAKNKWKVSIRSKEIKINGVATKYNGGGHDQASGAEIYSLDELPSLIADLDSLID